MVKYSKTEDSFNSLSHLGGFLILSILILPLINTYMQLGDTRRLVSFIIYYLCVGAMFLSSGLYHGTSNPRLRRVFRLIDHCAIPLCIAGTYTPIIIVGMEGSFSRLILGLVWILALVGIGIDVYYFNKDMPSRMEKIRIGSYLLMGWISLLMLKPMLETLSWDFVKYIVLGGIFYTLGIIFYKNRKIPFNHGIWHIFILVATFSMYYGIYKYLA